MSDLASPRLGGGSVADFSHLSYDIKTKKDGSLRLLDNVSVRVRQGEMLAILGPSGAGKSTLLDVMSCRKKPLDGGEVRLNGRVLDAAGMADVASVVEQEDDHLGVLTVRETISYAARLSTSGFTGAQIANRVDEIITALGLQSCAGVKIGTPIQRGVSGGQKRRVTVGTGLVTYPRILFLDEPTSGLDSFSACEVMASIQRIARKEGIIVVATIHAPSIETLQLFDEMMVLAKGKVAFQGSLDAAAARCAEVGHPIPEYTNPSDHLLKLVSTDFGDDKSAVLDALYVEHARQGALAAQFEGKGAAEALEYEHHVADRKSFAHHIKVVGVLCERNTVNYSRNLLAYGVRMGMYLGMGFLLATIWIRLGQSDSKINDRLSVHFFSVAFLAFMSVAGMPAFLEERSVFLRERKNGLYGPLPFVVANTLVTIPFLFACALLFSVMVYWSIGLHPGAGKFFQFLAYLFLALLAAETQSALIAALVPIFIAALALAAFMNGFWMCVQGYFIRGRSLPRFWYYSFHFMDYQTYAFELLAKNDLKGLLFNCNSATLPTGECMCTYPASAATIAQHGQCVVSGQDVLDYLGFGGIPMGGYAGILIGIIVLYRVV
ncbi:hypothetical protein VHUM_04344 [Vanrija humicola]|uniref:ABC transporter domain-containing protein n=1 Tax=Vanrija humicola TaxID=5417 RepID=A0A7D8YYZ7_VANHU|nr:hypothetical protein VHUM_04344 [Vanrija humicola]